MEVSRLAEASSVECKYRDAEVNWLGIEEGKSKHH